MNSSAMGRFEETGFDSVVCPKPRRVGVFLNKFSSCYWSEATDSDDGTDLLDIILSGGGYGDEKSTNQTASSPPYFCGSPPSRAVNPVIQDVRFDNEKAPLASPAPRYSQSSRGGGCKSGKKPPAVRIEGFDCLNRDNNNRSISAAA
ncbi:putative Coatomer gamma-2 subunit / gamma-2 coat protein / gamma-2 COP [Hibiscus syriacus]|uniref:Coatomer gamma-2 subunit / gamma-2 coat protein / gamma-2 COP n=1 Tax=Hibiscus syriacus TaxID=106335 RepID=A0A6A3C0G7_HIBSY|nr:uncharacterized protein LOC120206656 [Hibiscus syriacus]KAE8722443.1 putative Coatomer gamma-2 subunit / gamma-2 coat protein / gamma-2 COP [Hibiscus syriacus]